MKTHTVTSGQMHFVIGGSCELEKVDDEYVCILEKPVFNACGLVSINFKVKVLLIGQQLFWFNQLSNL